MRDAGASFSANAVSSNRGGEIDRKKNRIRILSSAVKLLVALLLAKIVVGIVLQYGSYVPPDFEQGFLLGRKAYFFGAYGIAFYIHIFTGPISLILGALLMSRQWKSSWAISKRLDRWLDKRHCQMGRLQFMVVMLGVVPAGLVMATKAFGGFAAGLGLSCLGIATAGSMILAVYHAKAKRIEIHQRWAARCFILLCSPLLLRIVIGLFSVTGLESVLSHQIVAWTSWLLPLAIFEYVQWASLTTEPGTPGQQLVSRRVTQ